MRKKDKCGHIRTKFVRNRCKFVTKFVATDFEEFTKFLRISCESH